MGLTPGLGRSSGGEHSNPFPDSCLKNPRDKGVWSATVHRVAKSQTWVKQFSIQACTYAFGFLGKIKPGKKGVLWLWQLSWNICTCASSCLPALGVESELTSLHLAFCTGIMLHLWNILLWNLELTWNPSFCHLGLFSAIKPESEDIGFSTGLSQCPVSSLVYI